MIRLPYRKFFESSLLQRYGQAGKILLHDTDRRYEIISAEIKDVVKSGNPLDARIGYAAYCLALMQSMRQANIPFEETRTVCLEITSEYVRPGNKINAWLRKLPPRLFNTWVASALLPIMDRKIRKLSHPAGFRARVVTDKSATYGLGYGIDILECGICKLFQLHGMQEYTSVLCEVDKLTSALAGLELVRKGTLAGKADCCDFRFRKTN